MNLGSIIKPNLDIQKTDFQRESLQKTDVMMQNQIQNINESGVRSKEYDDVNKDKQQECQTCANRKYKDGSDDSGVSFQTPKNISPSQSASVVASHEREHYNRENAKASDEGKKVLKNEIRVFYSQCPECGKKYASGGETRTITASKKADPDNHFNTRGVSLDVTL